MTKVSEATFTKAGYRQTPHTYYMYVVMSHWQLDSSYIFEAMFCGLWSFSCLRCNRNFDLAMIHLQSRF